MEILVARLDFSLLDCRGAGLRGISPKAFYESVSSGETLFFFSFMISPKSPAGLSLRN